jgi:hypothetical protein
MNTKMKSGEKRKHPRVPVGLSLDIVAKKVPGSHVHGQIVDLSVGGMTFESDAELEEGASLFLKVNIPLYIRGEIRHMRPREAPPYRYGVRFHKIGFGAKDESRPEHFIAARFQKG